MGIVADFFAAPPAYALECNARIRDAQAILSDGFERAQYKNFLRWPWGCFGQSCGMKNGMRDGTIWSTCAMPKTVNVGWFVFRMS